MNRYIDKFLIKYRHPRPQKPQLSTHKHREVTYGTKEEPTPEEDTSPALENEDTKRIQGIFGSLFYHLRAVDNKLLVGLSAIGAQQAAATQLTNKSINKLLYYSATYPTNEILYCSREMMLCAHSDVGFHNESKCRIRAGAHIFCPKTNPCQSGTVQFSLCTILLNFSCPPLSKQNWGQSSLHPKKFH